MMISNAESTLRSNRIYIITLSELFHVNSVFLVKILTHISLLRPFCGTSANSAKPDQTPQHAASDQVLHCLLTEVFSKI